MRLRQEKPSSDVNGSKAEEVDSRGRKCAVCARSEVVAPQHKVHGVAREDRRSY